MRTKEKRIKSNNLKEVNVKELIKKAKTEKDYEQMLLEMLESEFKA